MTIETERKYKCKVGSFVTDNAANVAKMRKELSKEDDLDIFCYGCSAHFMNLLARDLEIKGVKDHVVQIMKYFKYTHFPSALLKEHGGKAVILPSDVRWNSMADCLESYISMWPILMAICEKYRSKDKSQSIDSDIASKIRNVGIKRNAEDYMAILKPTAIALDQLQSNNCLLSDAVDIWKKLEESFKELNVSNTVLTTLKQRMKAALTPAHYLAYMLDPRKQGNSLSNEEAEGMDFVKDSANYLLPMILQFKAKTFPFASYLFEDSV